MSGSDSLPLSVRRNWPLLTAVGLSLCAWAGASHAQLDPGAPPPMSPPTSDPATPISVGVSQTLTHDSNLFRAPEDSEEEDWTSVTALNFALDQPIGRQRLKGTASVLMNRYQEHDELDNTGHDLGLQLDWETIANLSGALGVQSSRRQYRFGIDSSSPTTGRNIENTNAGFARARLGGLGEWSLQAQADALQRKYSNYSFAAQNDLSQWSAEGGFAYRPSPDLTGGLLLRYTRITRDDTELITGDDVGRKSVELGVAWQATGASRLDLRLTRSRERHAIEPDRSFWTGGISWDWIPSGKLQLRTQLLRDTEGGSGNVVSPEDTMPAPQAGDQLRDAFIWTAQWSATAKINVLATAQWSRRKLGQGADATELRDRTTALSLGLRYAPARWLDFGCDVASEKRETNSADYALTRPYDALAAGCMAQFWFR